MKMETGDIEERGRERGRRVGVERAEEGRERSGRRDGGVEVEVVKFVDCDGGERERKKREGSDGGEVERG